LCSIETGWFLNNRYLQGNHLILEGVFRIRNVLIRIRIRRSVPLASQDRTNTSVSLILSAFIFRSRSLISCHIVWVKLRTKAVSHANVFVPAVKRIPLSFFSSSVRESTSMVFAGAWVQAVFLKFLFPEPYFLTHT